MLGGKGTRLYPVTRHINKHLLPIGNKPLAYYSITNAILAGANDLNIIVPEEFLVTFENLFMDFCQLGLKIQVTPQLEPKGISDGILLSEKFIGSDNFLLLLGDNVFYGPHFSSKLVAMSNSSSACDLLLCSVNDPSRFGVALIENESITQVVEKPSQYLSNNAITGIYKFSSEAVDFAKMLSPSDRGELEITGIISEYIQKRQVSYQLLDRGYAWFDAGTLHSFDVCANFIRSIEKNMGYFIGSPEEALYNREICSSKELKIYLKDKPQNDYTNYLLDLC